LRMSRLRRSPALAISACLALRTHTTQGADRYSALSLTLCTSRLHEARAQISFGRGRELSRLRAVSTTRNEVSAARAQQEDGAATTRAAVSRRRV
ncbi:hypothetical protein C8J57DRAFT_1394420, partial [Mycena rebaudengoi]